MWIKGETTSLGVHLMGNRCWLSGLQVKQAQRTPPIIVLWINWLFRQFSNFNEQCERDGWSFK